MIEHNIQILTDQLAEIARDTRADYHVTLAELIGVLAPLDDMRVFAVIDGVVTEIGSVGSYRGYYDDLALEPADGAGMTSEALHDRLKSALDSQEPFTGYKGGESVMDARTPLWVSAYGDASGLAIVSTEHGPEGLRLVLKRVDQ